MFFRPLVGIFSMICATALSAHEFWIDPVKYQVQPGEDIQAHFKVGSDFKGPKHGFLEMRSTRHAFGYNGTVFPLKARSGDRPAMNLGATRDGLITLVHETTDSTITYKDWSKFVGFTDHKDMPTAVARHRERGLPEIDFVETYRRHGKSLVAVGSGAGSDIRVGMQIEIVALTNPYTDDGDMKVQVWFNDAPRPNAQVEVFERDADGALNISLYRTDDQGIASFRTKPDHWYLVDNVALIERDFETLKDPAWHSAWASLTFKTPAP